MTRAESFSARSLLRTMLWSPWTWGLGATALFEACVLSLPRESETYKFLDRYCRAHPVEYVETALFFVGLAIVALKAIQLLKERRAFAAMTSFGPAETPRDHETSVTNLQDRCASLPAALQDTYWGRRLRHLSSFLTGTKNPDGFTDQLGFLAQADLDRHYSSHATLQVVVWSIPILGFLGTVMGITISIANLTIEQIDSSISEVTSGLGVAFDTTAIALAYSLVLGFTSLFVKLREEALLAEMDARCQLEAHRCFALPEPPGLDEAQQAAASDLLDRTHEMIDRHTAVWSDAVDTMREDWSETLDSQRVALVASIQQGSGATLEQHHDLLAQTRQMWLDLHDNMNRRLLAEIDQFLSKRQDAENSHLISLQEFTTRLEQSSAERAQQHTAETDRLLQGLQTEMQNWHARMEELTSSMGSHSAALLNAGEQLEQIAFRKSELAELQQQLNLNLQAIRGAEAFEETLLNLNAAVNLLAARARIRDAA